MPQFEFVGTSYAYCNGSWYNIGDTINAAPGTSITVYQRIRETENEIGTCAFRADKTTGGNKCRKTDYFGGSERDFNCSFKMPSSNEDIKLLACHYYGGQDLIHDTECCFKLRPTAVTCSQGFKVTDVVSGAVISGATVHCNGKTCTTGSNGKCSIQVEDNKGYDIYASKSGYEDSSTQHTWLCRDSDVTLKLRKIVVKCDQDFKVEDQYGDSVNDSVVMVTDKASGMGIGSCTTGYDGECTAEVDEDVWARACCYAPVGYAIVSDSCKDFTTCTTRRTLKLKKEPQYCSQDVKVQDKDSGAGINGVRVAARSSIGTIKKCTTVAGGRCTITGLIEGDSYDIYVDTIPSGYECEYYAADCEERGVIACDTERLFMLKSTIPILCDQPFIVKIEGTNTVIPGATVSCGGIVCTTLADGKCKIEDLNRDQDYTPAASHPSYDPPTTPPSSFKACTTIRTLYLKRKAVKEDTKLKCYDRSTPIGVPVMLGALLQVKDFPSPNIINGLVKFYINDVYVGEDLTDGHTGWDEVVVHGWAEVSYTPSEVGTFTIKAVFDPTEEYNRSECVQKTLTVSPAPVAIGKVHSYSPHSKEVDVDSTVTVKIKGKNVGDGAGDICLAVARSDTAEVLIHEVVTNIPKDGLTDEYTNTFTMPDNEVELLFDVGHIEKGSEVYDDEERATLTPKGIPEMDTMICDSMRTSKPEIADDDGTYVTTLHVGKRYTLKCWLYEKDLIHHNCLVHGDGIAGGRTIKFVRTDTGDTIKTATTQEHGFAGAYWTPSAAEIGEYDIKAVFDGDGRYNSSESGELGIEVKSKPDKGVIVTVRNVPAEGLTVECGEYNRTVKECQYVLFSEKKDVTPVNNVATFDLGWWTADHLCVRVLNRSGDVMDQEEDVTATPPQDVTLDGWLGRPYRSRIVTEPHTVEPDEGFTIKAYLYEVFTNEKMGENREVIFFRYTGDIREEIGAGLTDENGIARKAWSEAAEGTYEYEAEYDPVGKKTYPESGTVIITEKKCPIDISALEECPILKALQGTIVFTHLDTLRWYRNEKMSPVLVKTYYKLIPITGRIARHSRLARTIVRALSTFSIRIIERRWEGEIPYLQTLKPSNE